MSKRQKWIDRKIRKLVGEGKPNKQAVAIALAMAANKKFVGGGATGPSEEEESDDIKAYKRKVVGILGDDYEESKVTSLVDRMSSLSDEQNDPQLAKLSKLGDESVRGLADMVDSASKTFKRREDESKLDYLASYRPETWVTSAGSRNVAMNEMLDEVKSVQEETGLTVDEIIDLANDIIMSSDKPQEDKERMSSLIGDKLRDSLS